MDVDEDLTRVGLRVLRLSDFNASSPAKDSQMTARMIKPPV